MVWGSSGGRVPWVALPPGNADGIQMDERPLRWGGPTEYHRQHWPEPVLAASAVFGGSMGGTTLKSGAPTLCFRLHAALETCSFCKNALHEVQVRFRRKNRVWYQKVAQSDPVSTRLSTNGWISSGVFYSLESTCSISATNSRTSARVICRSPCSSSRRSGGPPGRAIALKIIRYGTPLSRRYAKYRP